MSGIREAWLAGAAPYIDRDAACGADGGTVVGTRCAGGGCDDDGTIADVRTAGVTYAAGALMGGGAL